LCARSGIPGGEADDVVQNVMIQLVKDLPALELDSTRGKFRSWLATVVIRIAIKYRSRLAKLPIPSGAVLDRPGTSDTGLDDREFRNILDSSLSRIESQFSSDELEAFSRSYFSNQPRREIANDLKRPISWVYRSIYKVTCSLETELSRIADDTILGIL
jgi:RNA polymerase sigma factor (sigma-70 family)